MGKRKTYKDVRNLLEWPLALWILRLGVRKLSAFIACTTLLNLFFWLYITSRSQFSDTTVIMCRLQNYDKAW